MTTKSLYFLAIAGSLLSVAPAHAATEHDGHLWANFTVIGNAGRFAYFAELQPRIGDNMGRMQQLMLRPAVGYNFSKAVTGFVGYAHVVLPQEVGDDRHENRLFLQLNWTLQNVAGGTVLARTRLEHRRLSTGHDTGVRVRQLIRYTHPLGGPNTPRALVHVEPFYAFNDTDWGARSGFDQLRSFAGFEVPIRPGKTTMDIGYMNQTINDPGGRVRSNHIASVTFWIRP